MSENRNYLKKYTWKFIESNNEDLLHLKEVYYIIFNGVYDFSNETYVSIQIETMQFHLASDRNDVFFFINYTSIGIHLRVFKPSYPEKKERIKWKK